MKFKHLSSLALLSLMSCSTYQYVAQANKKTETASAYRGIAKTTAFDEKSDTGKRVSELTSKIFQSYLMGHVALQSFDKKLDKDAGAALESNDYHQLQAIRMLVDDFEHQINDLYVHLVLTSASSNASFEQRVEAQTSLDAIGRFMDGIRTNGKELPENLKPLILNNLVEKQTDLYEELKALREDTAVTQGDEKMKSAIWDNMVLLRATRRSYNKDLAQYQVDEAAVQAALKEESTKKSFTELSQDIKKLSGEIKSLQKELRTGRSTSSDVFFPSTGAAGNLTGNGFPAKTWSITYDDGPGGKTTPQVLADLEKHGMKATFFVLAKQVQALPTAFKATVNAGHDIASHSYTHAQLTKLGLKGLTKEIDQAKAVIEASAGKKVKLFRLPYGAGVSRANIRSMIAASKMIHVFWNVDTLDWQDKNPTKIFNRTIKQMAATKNNAGIVLFHDIHAQSVVASRMLMDYMNKNNLKVCTVQAVVDQVNKAQSDCR